MTHSNTAARQFQQLLGYLERMGLDAAAVAARARLDAAAILAMRPDARLSTYDYAVLYQRAAAALQHVHPGVAWGAGIGTDAFRFRCYGMIICANLGAALARAEQFDRMLQPLTGYGMRYRRESDAFCVSYDVDPEASACLFMPEQSTACDNFESSDAVAKGSGLRIWYTLIGWLIGRNPEVLSVRLSASQLPAFVQTRLERLFQVPIVFDAAESAIRIAAGYLDYRIVQTPDSLDAFLEDAVYNLILQNGRRANTSAAIKSLIARDMPGRPPTLEAMAAQLHMSPSNLRRRLQQEGTSYQEIKDRIRRDLAYRHLREARLKVHEIASMLGFNEPSSFIRSFRNWSGLTPRQFQAQTPTGPDAGAARVDAPPA